MTRRKSRLELVEVSKSVNGHEILVDCNLSLSPGEVCAIIGPNGAGKTTLFKLITGLAFPSSGTISISGQIVNSGSLDAILNQVGLSIEVPEFQSDATAENILQLHFDLLNLEDHLPIDELLALVGLTAAAKTPVSSFSLGMKQRLALARAISHRPSLLILDEPSNGLDPNGISGLRRLITSLAEDGMTVLMASHVLTEIEQTAHTVALLSEGCLRPKEDLASIIGSSSGSLEQFYRANIKEADK